MSIARAALLLLACLLLASQASAKILEGVAKLNSENTEIYIGKFAFSAGQIGNIVGKLTSAHPTKSYFDGVNHQLKLCLFDDQKWQVYQKFVEEGSLCRNRLSQASMCFAPSFSVDKTKPYGKEFDFESKIDFKAYTHFMFVLLSDCMLEEYPADMPGLRYHIDFKNGESHIPADESFMPVAHSVLCLLMIGMLVTFVLQLRKQAISFGQVHLISLIIGAAMLLQLFAACLELMHLRSYAMNGIGFSVGFGTMLTRICQAASEMLVSCTLIALSLGWTLVAVDGSAAAQKNWHVTLGLVVTVVVGVQLALEIAASTYSDELNQFHDYEHAPGYILMAFRTALGVFFFSKISATAVRESEGSQLLVLLRQLRVQGTCWFLAFPMLVLVASILPAGWRHTYVTVCSIALQSLAMSRLMLMFFDPNSAFFKNSTLKDFNLGGTTLGASDLSPAVAKGPSLMTALRKTKVAAD